MSIQVFLASPGVHSQISRIIKITAVVYVAERTGWPNST